MSASLRLLSVVIPTLNRESVLLETLRALHELDGPEREILVIDQTAEHQPETTAELARAESDGWLRVMTFSPPSIPRAMNMGLLEAAGDVVLFLDDDIRPHPNLFVAHARRHAEAPDVAAVVGQVIQPWQSPEPQTPDRKYVGLREDYDFPFHSTLPGDVRNVMAGNLSVRRDIAIGVGGFDENFAGAAYRFETEFARRLGHAGQRIVFEPEAGIDHLRVRSGGTRTAGSHLTSMSPRHGEGDYYYAFRHGKSWGERWSYAARRAMREVTTKFHLTHPWWILPKLIGETRAVASGWRASRRAPQLISEAGTPIQGKAADKHSADS